MRIPVSIALVLTAMGWVSARPGGAQWQAPMVAMRVAEAKWLVARPSAYDFTVEVRCHCPLADPPPTFHVVGGLSTPASPLTDAQRQTYAPFDTIDDIFQTMWRKAGDASWTPFKFEMQYDATLSYPVHGAIDPSGDKTDDDVAFDVRGFTVVTK